jgi:hypothetical protein
VQAEKNKKTERKQTEVRLQANHLEHVISDFSVSVAVLKINKGFTV